MMVGIDAARQKSMASEVCAKAEGLMTIDWLRGAQMDKSPQPRVFVQPPDVSMFRFSIAHYVSI